MAVTTTTCYLARCDVCNVPLDGLEVEDIPIHWHLRDDLATYARDEGWTLAPAGKAVSYGAQVITDMAVCDASGADHQDARKLLLYGIAR